MIIRRAISNTIRGGDPSCGKDFLDAIGQKFNEIDKAKIGNLLNRFNNARNDNANGIND